MRPGEGEPRPLLDRVGARDDDDLVPGGELPWSRASTRGKRAAAALGRAEARRGASGEHDGGDHRAALPPGGPARDLDASPAPISTTIVGCQGRVAESVPIRSTTARPLCHPADDRVVGREPRVRLGHDEKLTSCRARRLGRRLRHRDHAVGVARVRGRRVDRRVPRAAPAGPGQVATLDHEAGHDAVEDRLVEEAVLDERDERGRGVGRLRLVDPDREAPAVGEERHVVAPGRREERGRFGLVVGCELRQADDRTAVLASAAVLVAVVGWAGAAAAGEQRGARRAEERKRARVARRARVLPRDACGEAGSPSRAGC